MPVLVLLFDEVVPLRATRGAPPSASGRPDVSLAHYLAIDVGPRLREVFGCVAADGADRQTGTPRPTRTRPQRRHRMRQGWPARRVRRSPPPIHHQSMTS